MNEQVSLLLANGHHEARSYPLGMVSDEAVIVADRINASMATEATLTMMAISANFSKPAAKEFQKTIRKLEDGE